ncbi:MAG: hypothetical protein ACI4DS_00340 [Eubacterium sp.]
MENKEKNSWMNDERLSGISSEKLEVLTQIVEESRSRSTKELIPFFIQASSNASSRGINFTDNETEVILDVLKARMTDDEIKRIETVRKLSKMIALKKK